MMPSHLFRNAGRVGVATAVLVSLASILTVDTVSAAAQALPPSTNPTEKVIYPAEGQTEQQQLTDQLECYRWSTTQTGWDPHQAEAVLREQHGEALAQMEASQGGAVGGAARGAIAGLAIGAIAGDAGKGAAIGAVAGGLTGGRDYAETEDDKRSFFDWSMLKMHERIGQALDHWGAAEPTEDVAAAIYMLSLNPAHRLVARTYFCHRRGGYLTQQVREAAGEFKTLTMFYNLSECVRPGLTYASKKRRVRVLRRDIQKPGGGLVMTRTQGRPSGAHCERSSRRAIW